MAKGQSKDTVSSISPNDAVTLAHGRHRRREKPAATQQLANGDCCCDKLLDMECASHLDVSVPVTFAVDFKARNSGLPVQSDMRKLKRGQAVRVLVYNYNPYMYQVIINHSDSSVLAQQSLTNFATYLDPSGVAAAASTASTLIGPAANAPSAAEGAKDAFVVEQYHFDEHTSRFLKSDGRTPAPKEKVDRVVDSVQTLYDARAVISDDKTDVDNLNHSMVWLKSTLEPTFYQETKLTDFLYELSPGCDKFSKNSIDHLVAGIETDYDNARKHIADTRVLMTEDKNDHLDRIAPYIDFAKKNAEIRFSDSIINDFYSKLDAFLTKCDSIASYKQQQTLISVIKPLQGLSTCYQSLPLYFMADLKTISIQMVPWKDTTARLPSYQTQVQLPWQQSRTWGVSAGIFCSSLHDRNYALQPSVNAAGDTVYNAVSDKTGGMEFGIDVLAYTGWNVSKSKSDPFFLGITFGAGSSISSNPKPRILFGATGILGDKNRLTFSAGLIGGYTQTLSSLYQGATNFALPTGSITKMQLHSGVFFSISYSFLSGS